MVFELSSFDMEKMETFECLFILPFASLARVNHVPVYQQYLIFVFNSLFVYIHINYLSLHCRLKSGDCRDHALKLHSITSH